MHRLIFCLMLVSFIAQQFLCCCAGGCVTSCDHNHEMESLARGLDTDNCSCGNEHQSEQDIESSDREHENEPVNDEHRRHLCVGSHVFYLSAERFEISRFVISHDLHWSWTNRVELLTSLTARSPSDSGPPRVALMPRSALCVYRI